MRVVEAMIACIILVVGLSAAVYISSVYSVAEAQGLEETGLNILHVLDDSTVIQKILNNESGWESELRGLIETLLPPDTFYSLSLFSAVTGQPIVEAITNMIGQEVSEGSDVVTLRDVATVSFPTLKRDSQKIDAMLIIDRSGTMTQKKPGDKYSKIYYAEEAAKAFVDQLNMSKDRVGLASFATDATLNMQLTNNSAQVKNAINALVASGWTNMGGGIEKSNDEFNSSGRSDALFAMILLSDGCANRPCPHSPQHSTTCPYAREYALNESDEAKNTLGVVSYTIGLGANTSDFDPELMMDIASSEFLYYYAPSAEDLMDIYTVIIRDLSFRVAYDMVLLQLTLVRPG